MIVTKIMLGLTGKEVRRITAIAETATTLFLQPFEKPVLVGFGTVGHLPTPQKVCRMPLQN